MSVQLLLGERSLALRFQISPIAEMISCIRLVRDAQPTGCPWLGGVTGAGSQPGIAMHGSRCQDRSPARTTCAPARRRRRPASTGWPAPVRVLRGGSPSGPVAIGGSGRGAVGTGTSAGPESRVPSAREGRCPVIARAPESPGAAGDRDPVAPAPAENPWPALRAVLDADLYFRAGQIAAGGLGAALADLAPLVTLRDGVLTLRTACDAPSIGCDAGLVMMPSVHSDRIVVVAGEAQQAPLLIYPARGTARRRLLTSSGLRALLGSLDLPAMSMLGYLSGPRSAPDIAERQGAGMSSALGGLSRLAAAGLVAAAQSAGTFQRTNLANLLLEPWCPGCL